MLEMFRSGGFAMFPTFVFGLLALAAAVRYAVTPDRRFVPLQITLGTLTLVAGGLGFVTGVMKSFSAIGELPPEDRWIWMFGASESLYNVALALSLLTIAALASSVGAFRLSRSPA